MGTDSLTLPARGSDITEPTAVRLDNVSSGYRGATVLRDITLRVGLGEVVAIFGKNGMGKSTLLKTIFGIVAPLGGTVSINGVGTRRMRPYKVARMGVSYIPQERAIFADLTVSENITLAARNKTSVEAAFDRTGDLFPKLMNRREQKAGTLSGGEQKMLLLARGLAAEPGILLIDEITEGLQPSVRAVLSEALRAERQDRGTTILLVEQDLAFAFGLADRYVALKLGSISGEGETAGKAWRHVANEHLAI